MYNAMYAVITRASLASRTHILSGNGVLTKPPPLVFSSCFIWLPIAARHNEHKLFFGGHCCFQLESPDSLLEMRVPPQNGKIL